MRVIHLELSDANAFVLRLHRHHKPVVGHRFSIGAEHDGRLVGVCIGGRPVARRSNYRILADVTRLCTDGTPNACSFLYQAAARAAKALGFLRVQTFILESEPGTSLKASGWIRGHVSKGAHGWQNRDGRRSDQPTENKVVWYRRLDELLQ
jgi:hypothetical protein